jgi:diguanylate cyclase (GGDEF)-like protein
MTDRNPLQGGPAAAQASARAARTRMDRDAGIMISPVYRAVGIVIASLGVIYAISTVIPFTERPQWLDTWFYSIVLVLTAMLALARPILVKRNRLAWTLVALAVTSWSVGDIYWEIKFSSYAAEDIPVPSLADAFYIGLYPLAYVGFVMLARATAKRLPASVLLDGVVTSLAAGAVFSAIALDSVLAAAGGSAAFSETITNLSYPIGDLVLMVVAVAALAMVRWRSDPIWWLLGLGAALFAVADTSYLFGLADNTYVDGSWVDGGWMLGLTFLAVAGSLNRRRISEEVRGLVALLVPIVFSLAALGVLIFGTFTKIHPIAIILASGCLVAAGARTAMTFEQTRELARTQIQAQTDELSGLGNRRLLDASLPAMLGSLTPGTQLVLTIVSVDHVAEINSILGYSAGDTVLNTVGSRLLQQVPADSVATRLGGVEMALLRIIRGAEPSIVDKDTRTLLKLLSEPVSIGETAVQIELSAGIAVAPAHATMPADLIRCAIDALQNAKSNRSEVEIYDPSQHAGNRVDLRLAPDLLRAESRNEFATWYQPKFDIASGRPVALETILRWHHPVRGIVEADAVQPLAARVGLTRQLTRGLLDAALHRCAAWQRQGVDLGVAVDVTAADVLDLQLPYELAKLINKVGVAPSSVTLEIAEEVLQIDPRRTASALGQFRHFGFRLALDHYGRSAPSLTRLRAMPVDELKLDPAFARAMLNSPQDAAVLRSTVELARSLNIATYVDGVDSLELYNAIFGAGCVGAQGPALGEPMNADVLRQWLEPLVSKPVESELIRRR